MTSRAAGAPASSLEIETAVGGGVQPVSPAAGTGGVTVRKPQSASAGSQTAGAQVSRMVAPPGLEPSGSTVSATARMSSMAFGQRSAGAQASARRMACANRGSIAGFHRRGSGGASVVWRR